MNDLLKPAIEGTAACAAGSRSKGFRAAASITGAIWALKGQPGLLDGVVLGRRDPGPAGDHRPVPAPRPVHHLGAVPADDRDHRRRAGRRKPRPRGGAGTTRTAPWDEFQAAYFVGEANWNYFVAPFIFARADFSTEEIAPWHEDGQVWRALLVTYPDTIVAHHRQQTYYFDGAGLLQRLDYSVDILAGGPGVHYPSAYREFDGIMVPTRRRVYVRNPDGSPVRAD